MERGEGRVSTVQPSRAQPAPRGDGHSLTPLLDPLLGMDGPVKGMGSAEAAPVATAGPRGVDSHGSNKRSLGR